MVTIKIEDNQLRLPNGKIITFNDEQYEGIKKIRKWLDEADGLNNTFTLAGFAGVGKSTVIKKILDEYNGQIAVSAPTHKAKKVIIKTTGQYGLTLHGLLGLRPDVNLDDFNPNDPKFNPIALPKICDFSLVVIDEASMINKDLYELIKKQTKGMYTKILFMGDPAQIPPVNEKDSIVFNLEKDNFHQLTKVERQDDSNPIMFIYDNLRNNLENPTGGYEKETKINNDGDGIIFTKDKRFFRKSLLEEFKSKEFNINTDHCKVIGWTNEIVMKSNQIIRSELFGDDSDIVEVGDVLMGYRSITGKSAHINIIENSADYKIIKREDLSVNKYDISGYKVKLRENVTESTFNYQDIFIVNCYDEENLHKYAHQHDKLRDQAKQNKRLWNLYYKFRRENILMKSIYKYENGASRSNYDVIVKDMDYAYAITGHKCISENTNILTKNGNILLKDIKIGDYVCTGFNNYEKVLNKFNSGVKKTYKLTTKSGYEINTSEDHKFLGINNEFVPLKNLNIGDYIPINRNIFIENINNNSKDIYYYLGLLVADGSYAGNRKRDKYRVDLTIGFQDEDNINFIRKFIKKNKLHLGEYIKKSSCINFNISNKKWREHLYSLGLLYVKGENKSVPSSVKKGNYQIKSNFIAGVFDGDGSINEKGRIVLTNNSHILIKETQQLLLEFGIISYIRKERKDYKLYIVNSSFNIYKKYIYSRLNRKREMFDKIEPTIKTNIDFIPKKDEIFNIVKTEFKQKKGLFLKNTGLNPIKFKRFPDHIKHLSYSKLNHLIELYEFNNKKPNDCIVDLFYKNYFYDEIINIEFVGYEQMYDLEVEYIHQFVANGFIVHNCQGSTYNKVFVIENDIDQNWNIKERNQIKYVALTRPIKLAMVIN